MRARSRLLAAAPWAAAAVLAVLAAPRVLEGAAAARSLLSAPHAELGDGLRRAAHARAVDPSWRMPLGPLAEAWLLLDAPAAAPAAYLLALALTAAGAGAAAALLGGLPAAAAAAAAALWLTASAPASPGSLKMIFYGAWLSAAALALAARAARPGPAADWTAGVVLGASLLHRSALVFLLPLLAAAAWGGRRFSRAGAASAARLLLPAAALLLPWAAMNARVHGSWTPFERGASDMLVVGGALGMTDTTPEGDRRALAPDAPEGPGVVGWAVRRVLREPAPFLAAVPRRLAFALSLQPWLVAAAALALWLLRAEPAARALGVLGGYFLLVHSCLATLSYYYDPLWPVAGALAAGGLGRLAGGRPDARPASRLLLPLAVGAALSAATAGALALRYASAADRRPPSSPAALEEALANDPGAPLVALEAARAALARGDEDAAASALARARGDLPRLAAARARLADRRGEGASARRLLAAGAGDFPHEDDPRLDLALALAADRARAGRAGDARSALARALELWTGEQRMTVARDGRERGWEALLRARAEETLAARAAQALAREDAASWAAPLAAAALPERPELARALALSLQEAGRRDQACPLLRRAAAAGRSARAHADAAVCAYLEGRRREALALLERARALDPALPEAALSLGAALEASGDAARARAVYADALERRPAGAAGAAWGALERAAGSPR